MSTSQTYAWLDTRARYLRQQPPENVVAGTERVVLTNWKVPVRVGAREATIRGTTSWVPLPEVAATRAKPIDRSGLYELVGGVLALIALVGAPSRCACARHGRAERSGRSRRSEAALAPAPLWRALLSEGPDALTEVVGVKACLAQLDELLLDIGRQGARMLREHPQDALVSRE